MPLLYQRCFLSKLACALFLLLSPSFKTIFGAPLPGGVKDQTVLPLFWVEEGVQATEAFAEKLGKVPKLIAMCRNLMLALVAIGKPTHLGSCRNSLVALMKI